MLIGFMIAAGPITALLEWRAHQVMAKRTYLTPIPCYMVGVFLALAPWTVATTPTLWTVYDTDLIVLVLTIGIWYVFGCAGAATWLAYEHDRPRPTEADALRFVTHIEREHDGTAGSDPG